MKNSETEPTYSRLDGRSREAEHFTRSALPIPGSGIPPHPARGGNNKNCFVDLRKMYNPIHHHILILVGEKANNFRQNGLK
ncbi:MAG: hypothetical protein ACRC2T_13305 [Thermoguttaceae bacterium]